MQATLILPLQTCSKITTLLNFILQSQADNFMKSESLFPLKVNNNDNMLPVKLAEYTDFFFKKEIRGKSEE